MPGRLIQLAVFFLVVTVTTSNTAGLWGGLRERWSSISIFLFRQPYGDDWDILHHLGGNGPWIPRLTDGNGKCPLPASCSIVQAHTISRHAERYPTINAGNRHIALLEKLHHPATKLRGSLSFAKTWTYFTNVSDPKFENLTSTGPYAGTVEAYTTGKKLRSRYERLVPINGSVNFWSCDSPRDIETARHFADGFFGHEWEVKGKAKLHIIPESKDQGGNTLTPGRSCQNYRNDQQNGRILGYQKLAEFQAFMAVSINERLKHDAGGLQFTPLEIYGMMEFCGFELLVRGMSPWCKVFTRNEWLHYEYARDLLHFYRAGPGNRYAGSLGWLWLNATTNQLANNSASGVYNSFVHDGDVLPLLATMAIFNEEGDVQFLPSNMLKQKRRWRTSDVVPMGGRLTLERIDCTPLHQPAAEVASYIRLVVNEGLYDLRELIGDSNLPCAVNLGHFQQWVDQKGKEFGDFREICGLGHDVPGSISFLHQ